MPPRSWLRWSPVTSQLNERRGENCAFVGTLLVWRPYSVNTEAFSGGVSLKLGLSHRTPATTDSVGVTVHASCAYRLYIAALIVERPAAGSEGDGALTWYWLATPFCRFVRLLKRQLPSEFWPKRLID